jgi:hypothetical protein
MFVAYGGLTVFINNSFFYNFNFYTKLLTKKWYFTGIRIKFRLSNIVGLRNRFLFQNRFVYPFMNFKNTENRLN